jgi:hypothetical protein
MSAFLTEVKQQLTAEFDSAYRQLHAFSNDEDQLQITLSSVEKNVWAVVEKALKTSFVNGRKAAGAAPGIKPKADSEEPPTDWRRKKAS